MAEIRKTEVDDAIVDGIVNRAPSQNAVFDALAAKENSGAAAAAVAAHVALPDPHSQYALDTDLTANSTADRARANHTGTQLASTISDFAASVLATILSGLSLVTGSDVAATDSILVAIGKLGGRVNALWIRTISAGTGLTGGGDLSANRTISMANMPANTIKGNNTGGSAAPIDLSTAQATAILDLFTTSLKGLVPGSGGGTTNFLRADGTWAAPAGGGGVTDGDKGDITVSGGGATWTIDPQTVTNAKLANMATARFKGRTTAGSGDPEDLTGAQATALLDNFATSLKGLVPGPTAGDATNFALLRANGTWKSNTKVLPITINDLAVGLKLETLRIKTAIRIIGWDIIGDAVGSCVIDIVANSTLPITSDSIMGGSKPTLSAAQTNSTTGLTIDVAADSYLRAEVESSSGLSKVTIMLHYRENE